MMSSKLKIGILLGTVVLKANLLKHSRVSTLGDSAVVFFSRGLCCESTIPALFKSQWCFDVDSWTLNRKITRRIGIE
ncbi:hypothetical protein L3X38_014404 [Prunus dulcis]|uniref:Uncharacterized protein n=1 Tax=Prunus dulcis TaxID=3755 RepID=A0AAD4ZHY5_PRUDU|nr:hypothetical protein L3X38_014404 [Prunus dulcis]